MSIAIVTKHPINIDKYTSGQEYYLYMLNRVLPKFNLKVEILTIDQLLTYNKDYNEYDSYHLYYLGFKDTITLIRNAKGKKFVYHVYHIQDTTWTKSHEISWKAFLMSLQPLIDMYLATSKSIFLWLRSRAPLATCLLAEPYYECDCNSFKKLGQTAIESVPTEELRLLYIGRLSPYRSSPYQLLEIANGVSQRIKKPVRLTIVSTSNLNEKLHEYKNNNVTLNYINYRIENNEKCKLYRESHFFIFLARGNVAMNPPITLLETVYHGTIPIVSSWVLNDLKVPSELIADTVDTIIDRITQLWSDPIGINKVVCELKKSFKKFYDVSRFTEAIRRTL